MKYAQDGADDTVLSTDATFELFRCNADGGVDEDAANIEANGAKSWTTGADGTFTIEGLHVTEYADDDADDEFSYCLVETAAPAGYALNGEPIQINFKRSDLVGTGTSEATGTADDSAAVLVAEVQNLRQNTPSLPSTGGMGVGLLIAAGLGIMGFGAYYARRNSNKS